MAAPPPIPPEPLPDALSPTANVRRSCLSLMSDPPVCPTIDNGCDEAGDSSAPSSDGDAGTPVEYISSNSPRAKGGGPKSGPRMRRSVGVNNDALRKLARSIARSVRSDKGRRGQFAPWDEGGWHYTAESYVRSASSSSGEMKEDSKAAAMNADLMRMERVALYILTLDSINFCFWPTEDDPLEEEAISGRTNSLEYEHLAIALKRAAEADDDYVAADDDDDERAGGRGRSGGGDPIVVTEEYVRSEDTYALSPANLSSMTVSRLRDLIEPHLPSAAPPPAGSDGEEGDEGERERKGHRGGGVRHVLPNLPERVRLLNEVGSGLLEYHSGSALRLVAESRGSADRLVSVLTSTFPGFRDEAVDAGGRQVRFYKRAQIAAADLWAALGPDGVFSGEDPKASIERRAAGGETRGRRHHHPLGNVCDFGDIERLTMFADYRVPQLLRHLDVMRYGPDLSKRVDGGREMRAGSDDELYIRAATVVSVDRLVEEVNGILLQERAEVKQEQAEENVCAVKMDWHLWQEGERLDRRGELGNHHRVRTIFY